MKCIIIPIIIGATGIVTKSLRKNLEAVPGKHSIGSLQKTAVLGTSHIIRKVLQGEAWSLNGGDHRWFKRSTRKKIPVIRDIHIYNNNNNNNNNNKPTRVTSLPNFLDTYQNLRNILFDLLGTRNCNPTFGWHGYSLMSLRPLNTVTDTPIISSLVPSYSFGIRQLRTDIMGPTVLNLSLLSSVIVDY